jgi:hypothetical protein
MANPETVPPPLVGEFSTGTNKEGSIASSVQEANVNDIRITKIDNRFLIAFIVYFTVVFKRPNIKLFLNF